MKFLNILSLLGLVAALAEPEAAPETGVSPNSTPQLLDKRACTYNGCKCNSKGRQMTICGSCKWGIDGTYIVTTNRVNGNMYECSPDNKCCTYGSGSTCGQTCRIY